MIVVNIAGVPGDCQITNYNDKQWFVASDFSFDVVRELKDSGKAGTADVNIGVGTLNPCTIGKSCDKGTCMLMALSIAGSAVDKAQIHFLNVDPDSSVAAVPYLVIELYTAFVSSWKITGPEDERPTEEVALWYNKIAIQYHSTTNGKDFFREDTQGWDQVKNQRWTPKIALKQTVKDAK